MQTFIRELWELDKPTVAAVNGAAVGPGAHLALACDFVFVHAKHPLHVDVPEVGPRRRRRRRLPAAPPRRAPTRQGDGDARREASTGAEAVDLGLAYRCVDEADASRTAADELPRRLPPGRRVRSACRSACSTRSFETRPRRLLELEGHFQALATTSPDLVEGMAAFHEKRDAQFDGPSDRCRAAQRVAAYVVCIDAESRMLLCRLSDVTHRPG